MLTKRVIPTMLVRGRTLVKGKQYAGDRSIGHAQQAARVHAMRGVDELMILDIGATAENRGPDLGMVSELAAGCFIPITVGGGVRSLQDIDALLRAGADKVAICTAAFEIRDLVSSAAARFGSQAIVVIVEYGQQMTTRNGTEPHLEPPASWARYMVEEGAGEIVLSCTDRDGTLAGFDLEMIKQVAPHVSVPVIASGGCGSYEHMQQAFAAGADAVAAGAMFAFTDQTPRGAAHYLKERGLCVRL